MRLRPGAALFVSVTIVAMACGGGAPAGETTGAATAAPVQTTAPPVARATEASAATLPVVHVYKDPSCGCCTLWAEHLRQAGFPVEETSTSNLTVVKVERGVPASLQSCHTAIVDGYVIEGHVPAADIKRLLAERPDVAGLAVPGMPVGSPGMEMPGVAADPYDVVAFDDQGQTSVFASYR